MIKKISNKVVESKLIRFRFPTSLISDLKVIANKMDVPYQSYIKIVLAEAVKKELNVI